MNELLQYIIRELVGEGGYNIVETTENDTVTYTINAESDKIGRIIGKGGNIIKSIQDILRIKAKLLGLNVYINIKEI
jgi:Predicted RNA-binding protein (contains KH domain)